MNLPLKIALFEKGEKQIKAARVLGWDPSKLSKAVNGWIDLKPGERLVLAEYLGKTEEELFPAFS